MVIAIIWVRKWINFKIVVLKKKIKMKVDDDGDYNMVLCSLILEN